MRIQQEKIDEVRNAIDIVDLIGSFVQLKKRGKNFVGICPFHTEKTPSFTVSAERQMYHCFGCGVGGNVISFVMDFEKVSFVEAVRSLAEKAGVTLSHFSYEDDARASEQEQLYNICREAALFFHRALTETSEGKIALEYFHYRGFSDETIKQFGLGYSPNSWDAFLKHSTELRYPPEVAEKAGLLRKREDGSYYDYFRGRAMFPIILSSGRVVGFGARKLSEDDPLGKYINSPETLIYNKSKILYGIFHSKEAMRENDLVILVEGYADLISVFQSGIKNIVASSGTALTTEQIQLISRYTKNVTIVYDADSAGSKASLRGIDLILENDLDVRICTLPEGEDPDSFVKKFGRDAFKKHVDESASFVDFIARSYISDSKYSTPEGMAQTVRGIVLAISKIKDELKRNFYIRQVAEKYRLYESVLNRELEKIIGESRKHQAGAAAHAGARDDDPEKKSSLETAEEIPAYEKDLLRIILDGGGNVLSYFIDRLDFSSIVNPAIRDLIRIIILRYESGLTIDPASFLDTVEDQEQREVITEVLLSKYNLSKGWDSRGLDAGMADPIKIADDILTAITRRSLQKEIEKNQQMLKEASRNGKDVMAYLERHQSLLQQLQNLGSHKPDEKKEG